MFDKENKKKEVGNDSHMLFDNMGYLKMEKRASKSLLRYLVLSFTFKSYTVFCYRVRKSMKSNFYSNLIMWIERKSKIFNKIEY